MSELEKLKYDKTPSELEIYLHNFVMVTRQTQNLHLYLGGPISCKLSKDFPAPTIGWEKASEDGRE